MKTVEERFWEKVPNRPEEGCWEWGASTKPEGYGQMNVNGRPAFAHRVSFEIANGPIPAGMLVRHKCDNSLCVRPDHLELGTQTDNMRDMISRGRARHPGQPGELNPAAKLTNAEVSEIRSDTTRSLSSLAREHGVSPQRISQIQQRKTRHQLNADGEFVEYAE